jgi:plasmid stabilization system protein ParE
MKRRLVWSRSALEDLKRTLSFIAKDDETAVRKLRAAIDRAARLLADHPTGRRGRVAGTYEKSVTGLPYVIAYALATDRGGTETVAILRVIHTSRDWKPGEWPPD